MGKVFISHSSKDGIISLFVNFLTSIGIKNEDIFCSSLEGQGVKNGQRINDEVVKEFKDSSIVIYLITNNFINSNYCIQELGFALACDGKKFFTIKFEDVDDKSIKGFIDSTYKYNLFNTDGLSSLYDELNDIYKLNNKTSVVNRSISKLLTDAKQEITVLIEDKDKTDEEINKKKIDHLESQYQDLSIGEKRIIAHLYFSDDRVDYYSISNGVIGLLESKLFIVRVTTLSIGAYEFAYTLQKWVIDMIKKDKTITDELKKIVSQNSNTNCYHYW